MRKSLIITAFIMLLCLCGCEAVSPVLESSEPQRASETLLAATIAQAESTDELETTTKSSVEIDDYNDYVTQLGEEDKRLNLYYLSGCWGAFDVGDKKMYSASEKAGG